MSRLWLGRDFPLEVWNKRSEGENGREQDSTGVEEEGGAGDGDCLEEGLASGVRRGSVKC